MTNIKIEGAGYPIRSIFSDAFFFNIPNYQRPYAWTTEQTEQLLNDLLDALENETTDISEISPYFLGNIVLIKPIEKTEAEVVDGQQRLTTLTILFAVLKKLLPAYQDDLTELIYQPEKPLAGIPARPRLVLRERDRIFFETYIQIDNGIEKITNICLAELSDSQRNIIENAVCLLKIIAEKFPSNNDKLRLTQFLLQRCYLVIVHTPDFDSAYRIFSVLNDRGLDLSVTDILKADVIGKFSEKEYETQKQREQDEAKYTRKWEDLEEKLGRKDFSELFSHLRMIGAERKLEATVIKSFRTYVLRLHPDPCCLIDEILEPYGKALYDIKNCTFISDRYQKEINQLFKWLQRIDHFDWIAPAILFVTKYRYEPEKLLKFFTLLERLAAGLMIQRAKVTERISRYSSVIKMIKNNSNLLYNTDSLLQLSKKEQQIIIELLNGDIYNKYKARSIRVYILLRLETAISDGIPNYDSHKKITIEHILPQKSKSNSEWFNWFPVKEDRDKYVHQLSNLVLLSQQKNSSAANYDFVVKKDKYFKKSATLFALTIQVLNYEQWTPMILEQRQIYLLEILKEIWNLEEISFKSIEQKTVEQQESMQNCDEVSKELYKLKKSIFNI